MPISRRAVLAAGAALPLLGGKARAARPPGTLRFGLSSYPPTFAPWANAGTAAANIQLLVFRGLLSYDTQGKLQGELAESWHKDGDAGWLFKLRKAVFHNGKPVTAADVKWTLEQVAGAHSTAYMREQMQTIARIDTPDPMTVRLVMKQPTVTVPIWLAGYYMPIVAAGSHPHSPMGCGPYVMKSHERGVSVELEAFGKFYRPGLPKLKTLRFVAYPDESLRVAALQSGDVDIIEYVPWQSMGAIAANPHLVLQTTNGPFMYLTFNGHAGPFTDARVRLAVAHGIHREQIVKAAFYGRGAALAGTPIPPGTEYYDPKLANGWAYDTDRAKALLKQAGKAGGFACTLLSTAQYGMHKDTAEVVQQNLAALGIEAKLNLPEWASRVALGNRGQYEFGVMGTATDSNDPDGLSSIIDGSLPPSYVRSYELAVPKLHALLAAGRAEFDAVKRKAIYERVQKLVLAEAPIVGLSWRSQGYAMAKDVHGFTNLPGALTFYSGSTLAQTSFA
ncbi:MAG TPA: ABC transporter substrate-binding protein [Acetobacteraceae bacterium]|nr:ABC transporter substrate-binding protein [Acetobacteraceae bacterium]